LGGWWGRGGEGRGGRRVREFQGLVHLKIFIGHHNTCRWSKMALGIMIHKSG
jgi:hypothetical protein